MLRAIVWVACIGIALFAVYKFFFSGGPDMPGAGGAVAVNVQTMTEQNIRTWSEFSGRLRAVDYAEVRPEVSGRITEVRFEDGQTVNAGDILFVIDPRPFEATVARNEAALVAARNNASFAKTELSRAEQTLKTQAIPKRVYDERANDSRVANAAIAVAEAEVRQAKLDLEHAYVKAPITGRVSRAEITVGNVVQSGPNAPVLTSIVSKGSIYADFEVDEQTYMQSIRSNASGNDQERTIPVELSVKGDKENTYAGTIYSFDNRIDNTSGTIRARAKFANEDGALMPGMFVSVRLASSGEDKVLLVPERAIGIDQNKKFVYVVGEGNKVAYREITLGKSSGSQRIVLSGLSAGEKVVVDGIQHIRPDAIVEPKEVAEGAAPQASAQDKMAEMK